MLGEPAHHMLSAQTKSVGRYTFSERSAKRTRFRESPAFSVIASTWVFIVPTLPAVLMEEWYLELGWE